MAKFRQIHCSFWEDAQMIDLTPENRYFYLYLLTNPRTTQCGVYELPMQVMAMQLGYSRETVQNLMERFVKNGKVLYNEPTKEIMVLNWIKYNGIKSPKVRECILKELRAVKHQPFVEKFIEQCKLHGYPIDTVSIPYPNGTHTPSIRLGEEEEVEVEEEKTGSGSAHTHVSRDEHAVNIYNAYEQYFGVPANPTLFKVIMSYVDDGMSSEVIVEAFRIARAEGKPYSYAKGIVERSFVDKLFTKEQFDAAQAAFEEVKAAREQTGAARQGGEHRGKDQQRDGKPADSITGGQTGWIGR